MKRDESLWSTRRRGGPVVIVPASRPPGRVRIPARGLPTVWSEWRQITLYDCTHNAKGSAMDPDPNSTYLDPLRREVCCCSIAYVSSLG